MQAGPAHNAGPIGSSRDGRAQMTFLVQAYAFFYQFADAFAFLTLCGLGLAIISG